MTTPIPDRDEFPEPRVIVHETPVADAGTLMNGVSVHYLDFRANPATLNRPAYTVVGHTSDPDLRWMHDEEGYPEGYVLEDAFGRRRVDALTKPGWYVADAQPIGEDMDFLGLGAQAAHAGLPPVIGLDANFVRARALMPHLAAGFERAWMRGWHQHGPAGPQDLTEWERGLHERFDFTTLDKFLTRLVCELRSEIEVGLARAERLPVPAAVTEFLRIDWSLGAAAASNPGVRDNETQWLNLTTGETISGAEKELREYMGWDFEPDYRQVVGIDESAAQDGPGPTATGRALRAASGPLTAPSTAARPSTPASGSTTPAATPQTPTPSRVQRRR